MDRLKVGDVIIGEQYNRYYRYIVTRVTKTLAISKIKRFKIEYRKGYVRGYDDDYSSATHRLATPELEREYREYKVKKYLRDYNFTDCDTATLDKVYDILRGATT